MKKIILILILALIKLNAYEYFVVENYQDSEWFYLDEHNGLLQLKKVSPSGISYNGIGTQTSYNVLRQIRANTSNSIGKTGFLELFKNDNKFLNDFYIQSPQVILNYFYNTKSNWSINHIQYNDYVLLYNSEGLVVESIVDGVWAGLYSDSERGSSGRLYSSSGVLLYINAEPVNTFQQWLDPVFCSIVGCLTNMFSLIASPIGVVVLVVFVLAMLYFVVWLGRKSLGVRNGI